MPGNNDIHPRSVAEQVHRLIPNARWAEVYPHAEDPDHYVRRVLQFLAEQEASAQEPHSYPTRLPIAASGGGVS